MAKKRKTKSLILEQARLAPNQQTIEKYAQKPVVTETNYEQGTQDITVATTKKVYKPLGALSIAEVRTLVLSSMWVNCAVKTIVDECIKYDLVTAQKDEEIDGLLKYPSFKDNMVSIRKQYLKDMLRYGNGACAINYKGNKPFQLVPLPGYALRVTESDSYKILDVTASGEKYIVNPATGAEVELMLKECMHFCFDKDSDATMGRPPVESVYSLVLTDINLTAGLRDFTSKGFYKPFFLSGDGINKTDMTALLEFIEAGMIEANRSFGVNKNMTLKDMPVWDTKEMLTAIKEVGMAVSTAYGVPPFMINLVSDAGSMNAREQYAKFISSIVEPLVKYEAYVYSVILAKLGFKKTDVDITYKDTVSRLSLDRARVAKDLVNAGIITPNEARANYYNLPEIEGGDKLMKKSDLVPDVES